MWSYPRNTIVEIDGKPMKVHYSETCTLKSVNDDVAVIESSASELWVPGTEPLTWKQIPLKAAGSFTLNLKTREWVSLARTFECEIEKGKPISRRETVTRLAD